MSRALFVFTLSFLSLGCHTVNESKLIGTWRAEASCVTITLVVNPDHSFVQSVRTHTDEINRLTGRWSLDRRDKMMTFRPFLDFLNDRNGRQMGFASFPPVVMGPVIEMGSIIVKCPDSDHQIDYVK